jgi:hypothetical protein
VFRPFAFLASFRLLCGVALVGLLAALGCVDNSGGGRNLYLFEPSTGTVMAWDDINAVYGVGAGATAPSPDRTIQSAQLSGITLAWGGLAVDSAQNLIYLVTESGTVFVITKASSQSGVISNVTDIYSFTLGYSSQQLSNAVFGQVALDATSNTLYAQETTYDGKTTQVWVVPSVSSIPNGSNIDPSVFPPIGLGSDQWGVGVAAVPGGGVFGLFANGQSTLYDYLGNGYTGARLRLGSRSGFVDANPLNNTSSNVLIGPSTLLATMATGTAPTPASIAFDPQATDLYVIDAGSSSTTAAVLVFRQSQFTLSGNLNQSPNRSLGDAAANVQNVRVLSHPTNSDWLLGANIVTAATTTSTGDGGPTLLIWKTPSTGAVSSVAVTIPGVTTIRGMALGGTS